MKKLIYFFLFIIFFDSSGQGLHSVFSTGNQPKMFPALSGQTSFAMTDIPLENIPNLYLTWDIPAGRMHKLLVYVHGWDGGGSIASGFDAAAMAYLKQNGIAFVGVGMRGRNTGTSYANVTGDVDIYRDAGALEQYDVWKSIQYLFDNVVPDGQIDKRKIGIYAISGGGGAGAGLPGKFPGLVSTDVIWYGVTKYGTYETDPRPTLTSWYSDGPSYAPSIATAVGGIPKGSVGYTAGDIDEYYISRDHHLAMSNSPDTRFHFYHSYADGIVRYFSSDAMAAKLLANGQYYNYYFSADDTYTHNTADLLSGQFDLSPQHGLHWISDLNAITRQQIDSTGTLRVNGYVIPVDDDLEAIFELWIKTYRKNSPANPANGAYKNQGKASAAVLNYDLAADTFQVHLVKGNTSVGDQFKFIDLTHGNKSVMALLATTDTVTLKPQIFNSEPAALNYNWQFYYDFSNENNYLLDDQVKVSNAFDLTGNNNFAFEKTRANRAALDVDALDNGVLQLSGVSGTLATSVDVLTLTNEMTIVFSIDPDAASVASLSEGIIGKAATSGSAIEIGNSSGNIQISFNTESNSVISNSTPVNTDLGKQVWCIRRDGSNNVTATCINSTSTYTYTLGTLSGSFIPKIIGASTSETKQFDGKIYKVAVSDDLLSDTDVTTLLTNWLTLM